MALAATKADTLPRAGAALSIPLPATVGAAAFRRGNTAMVVFDDRRPIDLSGLHDDPVFGSAVVEVLPAATVLRFPLPPGRDLALTQTPQAWRIGIVDKAVPAQPIVMQAANGQVTLPVDAPGDVVAVIDPETGVSLLVGTQRATAQAVPAPWRTPDFDLLPTWQGVVVDPLDDNLVLRATPSGFTLTGGARGLAASSSSPPSRPRWMPPASRDASTCGRCHWRR